MRALPCCLPQHSGIFRASSRHLMREIVAPGKEAMTIDKSPHATASSSAGSCGRCSAGATCVPADKRLRDLVRLRLLTRRTQGNTKADAVVVAERRGEPVAVRRPTSPGDVVPTSATERAERAGRRPVLPVGRQFGRQAGGAGLGFDVADRRRPLRCSASQLVIAALPSDLVGLQRKRSWAAEN